MRTREEILKDFDEWEADDTYVQRIHNYQLPALMETLLDIRDLLTQDLFKDELTDSN